MFEVLFYRTDKLLEGSDSLEHAIGKKHVTHATVTLISGGAVLLNNGGIYVYLWEEKELRGLWVTEDWGVLEEFDGLNYVIAKKRREDSFYLLKIPRSKQESESDPIFIGNGERLTKVQGCADKVVIAKNGGWFNPIVWKCYQIKDGGQHIDVLETAVYQDAASATWMWILSTYLYATTDFVLGLAYNDQKITLLSTIKDGQVSTYNFGEKFQYILAYPEYQCFITYRKEGNIATLSSISIMTQLTIWETRLPLDLKPFNLHRVNSDYFILYCVDCASLREVRTGKELWIHPLEVPAGMDRLELEPLVPFQDITVDERFLCFRKDDGCITVFDFSAN